MKIAFQIKQCHGEFEVAPSVLETVAVAASVAAIVGMVTAYQVVTRHQMNHKHHNKTKA